MTRIAALIGLALNLLPFGARAESGTGWNFSVYLDERRIGQHRFEVSGEAGNREMQGNADFGVSFLRIPVYSYQHHVKETWKENCLESIEATTDDNGTSTRVRGNTEGGHFVVERGTERVLLPGCVMTFAYWNPKFREQTRLLNPQTGELLDVQIERLGTDQLRVGSVTETTTRYRLKAKDLEITLWYADGDRWVGLDSTVSGGRRLRYRLEGAGGSVARDRTDVLTRSDIPDSAER